MQADVCLPVAIVVFSVAYLVRRQCFLVAVEEPLFALQGSLAAQADIGPAYHPDCLHQPVIRDSCAVVVETITNLEGGGHRILTNPTGTARTLQNPR